jgi:hypothetical protein
MQEVRNKENIHQQELQINRKSVQLDQDPQQPLIAQYHQLQHLLAGIC